MSPPAPPDSSRVGITLVTGFLGSGKSTLIRRILTENHNLRIVVVENEFAENSSVEQAIVTQGLGPAALEEFIELPNGCICCAAQDDLTDALQRLVDAKRGRFDHILIEASGLADPGPVAASFWVDDGLDASLFLDSVITIVDAVNLDRYLVHENDPKVAELAQKQLAIADIVLLNKIDLVQDNLAHPAIPSSLKDNENQTSDADCLDANSVEASSQSLDDKLARIKDVMRQHGCTARVTPTTRCDVEISNLLNVHAYEEAGALETLHPSSALPDKFVDRPHTHSPAVGSVTLNFTGEAFDADKLDRVFGQLLWDPEDLGQDHTPEIWRMKAIVVISEERLKTIYQSVHTLFDSTPSSVLAASDNCSRFIFIGRHVDASVLQEVISRAMVT